MDLGDELPSASGSTRLSNVLSKDIVAPQTLPAPRAPQEASPGLVPGPKEPSTPFGHLAKVGKYEWELLQAELLSSVPEHTWGLRPCCNFDCTRLEGPCEMMVETQACGGGCGARYCCEECQEQAWRGGHNRNCAAMRAMREIRVQDHGK